MSLFTLYTAEVCPFAQRTRILIELKKLSPKQVEIDLTQDSEEWFLKLNPEGAVPTIELEGRSLYESSVVNEYLDEVYPQVGLMPRSPWDRGIARILIDYCNRQFNPCFYGLLSNQDRAADAGLREEILEKLRHLNDRLAAWSTKGPWVFQDFGMVELTYAPFFRRWVLLSHYRDLPFPKGVGFERVSAWFEALVSHPVVESTSLDDSRYIEAYRDFAEGRY